jgi:ribonuclease BN (tRNA processing enzyme)
MLHVQMLGTGTPQAHKFRCASSTLVEVAGTKFLIDCGYGTVRRLVESDINLQQVEKILFTHHHYDHNVDYPSFVLHGRNGRKTPLDVYGPIGTEQLTHDLFETGFAIDLKNRLSASFQDTVVVSSCHDIDSGFMIEGDDWRLTAGRADHFTVNGNFSLCYRIDTSAGAVTFSGDTLPCEGVSELAKGADVLVHEVLWRPENAENGRLPYRLSDASEAAVRSSRLTKHSFPEEVAKTAAEAGVKKLILTHLFSDVMLDELRDWMHQETGIEVLVAHDNLEFGLG